MERRPIRIVLAKVGLDGHDRGIKVVARALRDAGMHVIYAGLWLTPEAVVRTVAEEDADWLGLSLLSGAHMTLVPRILELIKQAGLEQVRVMVGGIIPEADIPKLEAMGVARVFGPGTPLDDIVAYLGAQAGAKPEEAMELLDRFRAHDRLALSRLLSLAARGEIGADVLAQLPPARARVVAFTGSGGVGKSTLIGKLLELLRKQNISVAVLACDPQSPLSGGALLGDRFRMGQKTDDGVFIRSLATVGGHGGLAENLPVMIGLMESFGFEVVIVETVGSGQGDVAVRAVADVAVLLLQPESGDDVQWEKAGVLEIADVVVVHKSDLPGADETLAQVRGTLDLSGGRAVPVLGVSSKTGAGLEELWQVLAALPLRRQVAGAEKDLLMLGQESLRQRYRSLARKKDSSLTRLLDDWRQNKITADVAIARLFELLAKELS